MNNLEQEKLTERLIAWIDGQLSEEESKETSLWVETDEEVKKQYEQLKEMMTGLEANNKPIPSDAMTIRFDHWLEGIQKKPVPTVIRFNPRFRIAAALLVLILATAGVVIIRSITKQRTELARIKDELELTKQMVITNLSNTQSASQRISAVYSVEDFAEPDLDIVGLLISTMNEDPSSNVRMAALDALSKYYKLPEVRKALLNSMKFQKDPVVQIALIQLLVRRKEKIILNDLQQITGQQGIIKAVKDEAYKGIFKLT